MELRLIGTDSYASYDKDYDGDNQDHFYRFIMEGDPEDAFTFEIQRWHYIKDKKEKAEMTVDITISDSDLHFIKSAIEAYLKIKEQRAKL